METHLKISLQDLDDKSIFIDWPNEERVFLFNLLLKKIKLGEFAKMIGHDSSTMSDIKNGKVKPAGHVYFSILKFLNVKGNLAKLRIASRNFKAIKIRNPLISPELIGLIHTDGHMNLNTKGNGSNFYFCNKNKSVINRFKQLLFRSFVCEPLEFKDARDGTYYVYPHCVVARIIAKKIGWKSQVKVPNISHKEIGSYLRGVFDGDGTISVSGNGHMGITPRIQLCSGSLSYAVELQELLKKIGIHSRIQEESSKGNRWFDVDICRQKDVSSFIHKVKSSHPKKKKRMRYVVKVLANGNHVPSFHDSM